MLVQSKILSILLSAALFLNANVQALNPAIKVEFFSPMKLSAGDAVKYCQYYNLVTYTFDPAEEILQPNIDIWTDVWANNKKSMLNNYERTIGKMPNFEPLANFAIGVVAKKLKSVHRQVLMHAACTKIREQDKGKKPNEGPVAKRYRPRAQIEHMSAYPMLRDEAVIYCMANEYTLYSPELSDNLPLINQENIWVDMEQQGSNGEFVNNFGRKVGIEEDDATWSSCYPTKLPYVMLIKGVGLTSQNKNQLGYAACQAKHPLDHGKLTRLQYPDPVIKHFSSKGMTQYEALNYCRSKELELWTPSNFEKLPRISFLPYFWSDAHFTKGKLMNYHNRELYIRRDMWSPGFPDGQPSVVMVRYSHLKTYSSSVVASAACAQIRPEDQD